MSFSPVFVTNPNKKIEKNTTIDNISLIGTNAQSITVDVSNYKKMWILASSGYDAEIDIRIRQVDAKKNKAWNGSAWQENDTVIIPADDQSFYQLNTALPHLNDLISDSLIIRIAAKSAHTTGSVSVTIFGEVF